MTSTGNSTKSFDHIHDAYAFFVTHSDEAVQDLAGYRGRLSHLRTASKSAPLRMLDFGCGPGEFSERFLQQAAWAPDQLQLTLIETDAHYRQQAVNRLAKFTQLPIADATAFEPGLFELVPGKAYDVMLANHVFYYVVELQATVQRLTQALTEEGVLLTALAGHDNVLIQMWDQAFAHLGIPLPYHTAETLIEILTNLPCRWETTPIQYTVRFPDSTANRLLLVRFLLHQHLDQLPPDLVLSWFDSFAHGGHIEFVTGHTQFAIQHTN